MYDNNNNRKRYARDFLDDVNPRYQVQARPIHADEIIHGERRTGGITSLDDFNAEDRSPAIKKRHEQLSLR